MQSTPAALKLLSILALLLGDVYSDDLSAIAPALDDCDRPGIILLSVGLVYSNSMNILHVLSPIHAYVTQYHQPQSSAFEKSANIYIYIDRPWGEKIM